MLYVLPDCAVLYQCLGGPAAVLGLEFLIASGASKILTLSFCGSLDRELRIGDVLSVTWAYPDEGTSGHYSRRKRRFKADGVMRKHVESRLESLGLLWKTGNLVSTDAPYRETRSWMKTVQRKGATAVDMEISAVFALSVFRAVEAAALMIVTDELFSGRWKVCSREGVLEEKIRDYYLPFL
jgi:purine-nucleoside phosphorylase